MRGLLLLLFSLCVVPPTQEARTGVITGRVVTEDGSGLPGVTVTLTPVAADRRTIPRSSQNRTSTDEDGNFKFTSLASLVYSVSASSAKGYAPSPATVNERRDRVYHRIGANVTITMIKGGAITGRVTNAMSEPVIGVQVNAAMARGAEGSANRDDGGRSDFTDDRGVYRIYGLSPGTYVVFTRKSFQPFPSPYDNDGPTYYPSSTRETAAEVTVTGGGEASGVDIRYRGERGHAVSGSTSFSGEPISPSIGVRVALTNTVTGVVRSDADFFPRVDGRRGFAIYGATDGEYEITGRWILASNEEVIATASRRVVVKGADAGGIELKFLPMASITGKFAIEATPGVCESKRKWLLEEALLAVRPATKQGEATPAQSRTVVNSLTEKGEFTVYYLAADRYFLEPRLPNENWYVKAITTPASNSANTSGAAAQGALLADIARGGITLKAGEKITGVVATIADGAAGLSGKVISPTEGSRLPARLRIHLIPAEARAADEVLRYAEAYARSDGSFLLSNLAPGKYWLIARAAPDDGTSDLPVTPVAWDATERAKLRRQAMTAKNEIELRPCGRVKGYGLRFDR